MPAPSQLFNMRNRCVQVPRGAGPRIDRHGSCELWWFISRDEPIGRLLLSQPISIARAGTPNGLAGADELYALT
jgi:hypothetical protein